MKRTPAEYRLKRGPGGRLYAVVTLRDAYTHRRRDYGLGVFGSPESRAMYAELLKAWEDGGHRLPAVGRDPPDGAGIRVEQLCTLYMEHLRAGMSHGHVTNIRMAHRALLAKFRDYPAAAIRPMDLRTLRADMAKAGLSPQTVAKRIGMIVATYKWGAGNDLVPIDTYHRLLTMPSVKARKRRVPPVPDNIVDATIPHVSPRVRDMIQMQRLTGMRPGEVCRMRLADIDMSGAVWVFRPAEHKTAWRGGERAIYIGPRGQDIIRRYMNRPVHQCLFTEGRTDSVVDAYRAAIHAGCSRAGVTRWNPNQLRHSFATAVRRQFGAEASSILLGHSSVQLTDSVYAERDASVGIRIAEAVG